MKAARDSELSFRVLSYWTLCLFPLLPFYSNRFRRLVIYSLTRGFIGKVQSCPDLPVLAIAHEKLHRAIGKLKSHWLSGRHSGRFPRRFDLRSQALQNRRFKEVTLLQFNVLKLEESLAIEGYCSRSQCEFLL
jgi:hypothetical protein